MKKEDQLYKNKNNQTYKGTGIIKILKMNKGTCRKRAKEVQTSTQAYIRIEALESPSNDLSEMGLRITVFGGRKKYHRTVSIVLIIFSFWFLEISEVFVVIRNQ